ncbi:hypothetical protein H6G81_15980 [Scytonema hofmannii FACHB-248]|uniref:Uncharacterized protein n=2 Tax=Nostocales TaxID=1161 RepID=A0ABR8GS84_9CYAN|nr:hypothetical protein [Scytonema hofmannii]MBD2605980.1 hypothetical protein [Scytonema hofmannii FACHB-248]
MLDAQNPKNVNGCQLMRQSWSIVNSLKLTVKSLNKGAWALGLGKIYFYHEFCERRRDR